MIHLKVEKRDFQFQCSALVEDEGIHGRCCAPTHLVLVAGMNGTTVAFCVRHMPAEMRSLEGLKQAVGVH